MVAKTQTAKPAAKKSAAKSPAPAAKRMKATPAEKRVAKLRAERERVKKELAIATSVASLKRKAINEAAAPAKPGSKPRGNPKWQKGKSGNPNGRPVGSKNYLTEHQLRIMATTGMTPMEFLTAVYRDQLYTDYDIRVIDEKRALAEVMPKRNPETGEVCPKVPLKIEHRIAAATSAAPYVHRKMPIGIDGGEGKPLAVVTADKLAQMSNQELDQLFAILGRLGIGAEFEGGTQTPYRLDGNYDGLPPAGNPE
jgi:hypothetical protein